MNGGELLFTFAACGVLVEVGLKGAAFVFAGAAFC